MENSVRIIGGGLAGSEAAWQLARRGVAVELFEMRPQQRTEAHATGQSRRAGLQQFAALRLPVGAGGIVKAEMRLLDSLVIRIAEANRVPAGSALAVDRDRFSRGARRKPIEAVASSADCSRRNSRDPRRRHRHSRHRSADVTRSVGASGGALGRGASLFL